MDDLGPNRERLIEVAKTALPGDVLVDLGVRFGSSSTALLEANARHVIGVDPAPLPDILKDLTPRYTYLQTDSITASAMIKGPLFLVFFDTLHIKEQVMAELYHYWPKIRVGGWAVFHDSEWPPDKFDEYLDQKWEQVIEGIDAFFGHGNIHVIREHHPESWGMTFIKKLDDWNPLVPGMSDALEQSKLLTGSLLNPVSCCTVKMHYAGLFSELNKVMQCATLYDQVHVDLTGSLYGEVGTNVWNALFESTTPNKGPEIIQYPDLSITSEAAGAMYDSGNEWRHRLHAAWSKFQLRGEIVERACRAMESWNRKHVISILVRFDGHSGEQPSKRSQTLEEYEAAIREHWTDNSHLNVMAGDWETIAWFESKWPISYLGGTRRTDTRAGDQIHHGKQSIEDARLCMIETLCLANSNVLIHPVSNIATAALYINPNMESVYLR